MIANKIAAIRLPPSHPLRLHGMGSIDEFCEAWLQKQKDVED
jgi:hypothetical protein